MKMLKYLDLFGYQPKFNIDLFEKKKLTTGGIITLCFIFLYLYLFLYFGEDCFKKNPKGFLLLKKNEENKNSQKIKDNNFLFGVRINDQFGILSYEFKEVMYLTFEYHNVIIKDNKWLIEVIPLKTITCDKVKFDKEKIDVGNYYLSTFY